MFDWLGRAVLAFVRQYGYLAVFVYMVLETAFILHFVPSEVVVPFAAAQLVHDPASFVFFVVDATLGATLGSLLAYVVFGRYGREALERYGHVVHISDRSLERSERVFAKYGESSVFWARMLPLFRALISVPAGLAEMDLRKFVAYSAGGALLFNTSLTYLVYTGAGTKSPLDVAVGSVRAWLAFEFAYVQAHVQFVALVVGLVVGLALLVWLAREWIRANPEVTKLVALHGVRIVGLVVGGVFVFGAVSAPDHAFSVVTGVWDDPLFFVTVGFSERIALALTGVLLAFAGLFVYEVGRLVRVAQLHALAERVERRLDR